MLYHVSSQSSLTVLKPHVSTHGEEYVYAIEDKVTGLLFGAPKDDFDLLIYTENHHPVVYECYPDAMKKIYQYKSCSVYEVSDAGFLSGMTSWDSEFVCPHEVQVFKETRVIDLYQTLLDEETHGNIVIYRYEHTEEYRKRIAEHLIDRIIRFDINLDTILTTDVRFSTHYQQLVKGLKALMDGHLLQ